MDNILSFEVPKKVRSTQTHNETFQSDSGIAGTYVQNMTEDDKLKWKAKHIKGKDERIEIRKTIEGVQLFIVVYKNPNPVEYSYNNRDAWHKRHQDIQMSMNGKLDMTYDNFFDMGAALREAIEILL